MEERTDTFAADMEKSQEQSNKVMERLFAAAQPGAVYGQPVVSGNYTIITASEIAAGGGFGSGFGVGPPDASSSAQTGTSQAAGAMGRAGGGGGGGGSSGRPVAVIVIGPDGVQIKPIVDVTKLAIAGITAWGAMAIMLRRMRRHRTM